MIFSVASINTDANEHLESFIDKKELTLAEAVVHLASGISFLHQIQMLQTKNIEGIRILDENMQIIEKHK